MTQYSPRFGRALMAVTTGLALTFATAALASPGSGHAEGMKAGHHGCGARGGMMMSRLTVTGQGDARVAPDLAEIRLGVTSQADSAAAAMEQNAEQQTAVIEALKGAGIAAANIQTSGLNLQPRMEYPENGAPTIKGYEATNMVSVRVTEVAKLGEVLDAIVAAGANQINGIDFQREDAGETEDQARRAAVEDARHKAEILAEAAGLALGPVIVIRDAPVADGPRPMMMRAEAARDSSTPIEAGELSVSAQVQVEYALHGQKGGDACGPHDDKRGGDDAQQDDGEAEDQAAPGEPPASN
ncbi:SIMPL domain-containing protein [Paracoccus methylarcula]|uniref:SIMPL domain-containing protein n=1 Tax=Paracoccus methylarcula TaxID=72022 RepID=A0A3R7ND92_9RHOB|nr:SIMPL domain-containing protein [Paracoccus methylarcula]RNF35451.1 SIMPL domain-containing protein [Paracoccus methylarcula]